jgi:hypothetical protein
MGIQRSWFQRRVSFFLAIVMAMPLGMAAQQQGPQPSKPLQDGSSVPASDQPQDRGKAVAGGGADPTPSRDPGPDAPEAAASQAPQSAVPPIPTQGASTPQQGDETKPVGIAAAPYERTTGVAASRPAGAVIAPAKQKRARSLVIRVGIIAAAAVAIGTVAALSHGSSSHP